VLFTQVDKKHR